MTLDPNILRFNQIAIIAFLAAAALTGSPALVALVAAIMIAGTLEPRLAVFKRLYTGIVRPALRVPRREIPDDPRAHNFAQGLGGIFLALATLAFLAGAAATGWSLVLVVAALAGLNLTTG